MESYGLLAGAPAVEEDQIIDSTQNLDRYLKGQGLLAIDSQLCVLNASPQDALTILHLLSRLISINQLEDRTREQLRDQADKDRVALTAAHNTAERLKEEVRKCKLQVKELEGKLLAANHRAEEHERELQRRLKSAEARVNDLLRGSRDAGKRSAAAAGGAAASGGGGNAARRAAAPAYNRFQDDPESELAERAREVTELQKQNARLRQQLAAAERTQGCKGGGAPGRSAAGGATGGSAGDGRSGEQRLSGQDRGSGGEDVQSVRDSLPGAEARSPESLANLAKQQRIVRELEAELKQLRSTNLDLHRQLDKAARERSEHTQTVHALRSRCAGLEFELRKADDLALHAQRTAAAAAAAASDPVAAAGQVQELRKQLAARREELAEAHARITELQEKLAKAEAAVLGGEKHVGIMTRAVRAQKGGEEVLRRLEELVAEEVWPLQEKLGQALAEAAKAQAQCDAMKAEVAAAMAAAPPAVNPTSAATAASAGAVASPGCYHNEQPSPSAAAPLPLSPPGPLPFSPGPRFNGFPPPEPLRADSPPTLQPAPFHAPYNRAFASTMPSPGSRASRWSQPQSSTNPGDAPPQCHPVGGPGHQAATYGGAFPPPLPPAAGGAGGGYAVRRSLSAGVSAERRRWEIKSQTQVRYPSPIQIIMEQAGSDAPDESIHIAPGWAPGLVATAPDDMASDDLPQGGCA